MAAHHQIMALHENKTNWKVIVRVTTIWTAVSEDGDALRQNLILLDSWVYLQVFVYLYVKTFSIFVVC